MLEIYCAKCGDRIEEPGALVFGPPIAALCEKFHICEVCWITVELFVKGKY